MRRRPSSGPHSVSSVIRVRSRIARGRARSKLSSTIRSVPPANGTPMSDSMAYAAAVLRRCDELAAFTEEEGRLTRRFATPALQQAGDAVRGWMDAAGMVARRDAIGNLIGRLEHGDRRTLLIGSHLDTVRDAGRYDGTLGVLVAIACLERLRDEGRSLPYGVEVLGFADEEGVRFGTGYLGSSVVAGRF